MSVFFINQNKQTLIDDIDEAILLYESGNRYIYWLGIEEENAFRTNTYLIVDNEEAIVVDPGNRSYFKSVVEKIKDLGYLENVKALILCHQDPDVAASLYDWLELNPDLTIITSARTNVLLPHYGKSYYDFYDSGATNDFNYIFESRNKLKFIEAPFLHFPGAITTYDEESGVLFSGDIWAAIDMDYSFVVNDFELHKLKLDLFHIDYMASNKACSKFAEKLTPYQINTIFPQHGAIIPSEFVNQAIDYLKQLKCGLDIIYPD